MNIALITDTFHPQIGGTESVVLYLAKTYLKLGHNVAVFTREYDCVYDDSVFDFLIYRTKVFKFPFYSEIPLPSRDKKLNKKLIDFKPHVIHIHTPFEMGKWGVTKAKKMHIKSILTTHTYLNYINEQNAPFSKNSPIHKIIVNMATVMPKQTALSAYVLTTVSEYVKREEIENVYGIKNKTIVIRNGFDYSHLDGVLKENNLVPLEYYKKHIDKKIHLCFAGRIVKEKNIEFSLKVCKLLKERNISFDFTLAGDGNIEYFKGIAKKLDVEENVHFIGKQKFAELVKLYAKSDILLFPSIFDCDSIVGIESRALGCPSLVIQNTGSAERIIDGMNGYVLPDDKESFADKIEEFYIMKTNNIDTLINLRNNTLMSKADSWEDIAKLYLNLI